MRALALALILALGACQWDPPSQGARDDSVPPLTVEGYGDMRIGTSLADARRISGQAMTNAPLDEETPGACVEQEYVLANGEKLWLMFEGDVITRITAGSEAPSTRTAQNGGVGFRALGLVAHCSPRRRDVVARPSDARDRDHRAILRNLRPRPPLALRVWGAARSKSKCWCKKR